MFSFLSFILLIVIVFLLSATASIANVLQSIFGINKKEHEKQDTIRQTHAKRPKIIDKSEGEYVDFEEIKS